LGSLAKPFRSLYVSNNTVFLGGVPLSLEPGTNELRVNNVPISQNISYADIPNAPRDVSDLTDDEGLLGGGAGGGLSITDFGLGFTDTLDAGKITTSKLYNENPNQGLNNQYTLEVTDGGVVALPDGSIINGATLKTIAGNYAGITAGPNGADEDSWVWVDNDGATIATKYSTDNYQWKFDNTGNLILPNGQSIGSGSLDGIKMTTDRGTVLFGNSPECVPTLLTHFHIMKDDPANVDLFLGDDNNYVKLPGSGETAYGVEIGTNVGSAYTWRFGTDGDLTLPGDIRSEGNINIDINLSDSTLHRWSFGEDGDLTLPAGGDILDSEGNSVLGGVADNNIWVQTFETATPATDVPQVATSVEYDSDGNIIALFSHVNPVNDSTYYSVGKYTTTGTRIWTTRFADDFFTDGWGLAVDNDGGFVYIAGRTSADGGQDNATLTKISGATGLVEWSKKYDFGYNSSSSVVDVNAEGDPVMVGYASNGDDRYVATTKIDQTDGSIIWSRALTDKTMNKPMVWQWVLVVKLWLLVI
jgi:hypothetical protein